MAPARRWLISGAGLGVTLLGFSALRGQSPPPQPLPPSVTKAAEVPAVPGVVRPVTGQQAAPAVVVPAQRFLDLRSFPPETEQAVLGARAGGEWLWRVNESSGRFKPGINPAWGRFADADDDCRQGFAAIALGEVARFTGEDKYGARAAGAVLALRTLTQADPANPGVRQPIAAPERGHKLAFAAELVLAIHAPPAVDAASAAEAEALCVYLLRHVRPNGAVSHAAQPSDEPHKLDPVGSATVPGLVLQAIACSQRAAPSEAKRDTLARSCRYYGAHFKGQNVPQMSANALPALAEVALAPGSDAGARAAVWAAADQVCQAQCAPAAGVNPLWAGGFQFDKGEPSAESAQAVIGLAAAVRVTRQVGDLERYARYRQAMVAGVMFLRNLQFAANNADHFEVSFRNQYLLGGVRTTPTDAILRADLTAQAVRAYLAFLQSGAEGKAD